MQKTYNVDAARQMVGEQGFGKFIAITESPEQLLAAIEERLASGDNVYDYELHGDDVVRLMFWSDTSHPRFFRD